MGFKITVNKKRRKKLKQKVEITESRLLYKKSYEIISNLDPIEGIRPGFEPLVNTKHLFVRPSVIREDHIGGANEENHYDIIDCDTGHIYFAWETANQGFGKHETFIVKVVDMDGRPILLIQKKKSWLECFMEAFNCCGTTGSSVHVNQPDGYKLREIIQKYNGITPKYIIQDEFEKTTMTVLGPEGSLCCYNCNMSSALMMDAEFPILDPEGNKIGEILRGCPDPMENVETYSARFPEEIPVEEKIALIGMIFTIHYMYFDRSLFDPDVIEVYEERVHEDDAECRRQKQLWDLQALGIELDENGREVKKQHHEYKEMKEKPHYNSPEGSFIA